MNPGEDLDHILEATEDHVAAAIGSLRDAIGEAVKAADSETINLLAKALLHSEMAVIEIANKRHENME